MTPLQHEGFVPPVIIIGMHRSGTSLIARILGKMGLFLGRDTEINAESHFFLRRNELILKACNGGWENPAAVEELLKHRLTQQRIIALLRRDLRSIGISTYLGLGKYLRYRSAFRLNIPWGWKDPRNTILLPLWMQIFPEAKVICILRNGVDSAASLADRESRRLLGREKHANLLWDSLNKLGQFVREGISPSGIVCEIMDRIPPQHKYLNYWVNRCLSVDYGFELWSYYTAKALEWAQALPARRFLLVKYEDFLQKPETHLARMKAFVGLQGAQTDEKIIISEIKTSRAYAFRAKPELVAFYETVRRHPLMQRCGYDSIECARGARTLVGTSDVQ